MTPLGCFFRINMHFWKLKAKFSAWVPESRIKILPIMPNPMLLHYTLVQKGCLSWWWASAYYGKTWSPVINLEEKGNILHCKTLTAFLLLPVLEMKNTKSKPSRESSANTYCMGFWYVYFTHSVETKHMINLMNPSAKFCPILSAKMIHGIHLQSPKSKQVSLRVPKQNNPKCTWKLAK